MQEEILVELFSIPIFLKRIIKVDDVELYGSNSLNKSYKKAMTKSDTASFASAQISKLVDDGKINPCYMNKGIYRVLKWKFFANTPKKAIAAFFSMGTNKVYIIIDNNISIFGNISDTLLGKLTIHEACHMASYNDSRSFFNLFSEELTSYYSNYFKFLFDLKDISEKTVKDFVSFLCKYEGLPKLLPVVESFLDSLRKSFKGDSSKFDTLRDRYILVCKVVLGDWRNDRAIRILLSNRQIIVPFYKSYARTFGIIDQEIFHFQEVVVPSEVVCVYSPKAPREKILSVLSLIK